MHTFLAGRCHHKFLQSWAVHFVISQQRESLHPPSQENKGAAYSVGLVLLIHQHLVHRKQRRNPFLLPKLEKWGLSALGAYLGLLHIEYSNFAKSIWKRHLIVGGSMRGPQWWVLLQAVRCEALYCNEAQVVYCSIHSVRTDSGAQVVLEKNLIRLHKNAGKPSTGHRMLSIKHYILKMIIFCTRAASKTPQWWLFGAQQ